MASLVNWAMGTTIKEEEDQEKSTKRGLPALWYRSPELYQVERRAIFSKKWILVTHKSRFNDPGDYLRITEAGFSFILILDRQGKIGGFHNICRHRGFPLIHDDFGKVNILSCKYHGWSYGLNGKLAKAPYFDKFADFVKENNGLLPVHVHIDAQGFIWVNLDASEVPAMQWDEQFNGVDAQPRMAGFDFSQYRYDHSWAMDGDCNWKVLADNYNECLHCKTAHPDTAKVVNIEVYRVEGKDGALLHHNKRQETGANDGKLQLFSTYYFPNACMTVSEFEAL